MSKEKIKYAFIGNISTVQKVAEYPESETHNKEVNQIFTRMARNKSTIKVGEISKIPSPKVIYYLLVSRIDYFFLIIVDSIYPEDNAHRLIEELRDCRFETMLNENEKLNIKGTGILMNVVKNYQDESYSNSKIKDLQIELSEVEVEVKNGVKKVITNLDDARELEKKSEAIEKNAEAYNEGAEELKKQARRRNIIITIAVIVGVIVLVLVIAIPVVVTQQAAKKASETINGGTNNKASGNRILQGLI